ncbi:hypothetical protein JYU04_04025, partial [Dehalococcoides mccartyi]|nr:hypothetical protein [Dehalococcoides mccartyi]
FDIKKNGKIKSVVISTSGEAVGGSLNSVTKCKEIGGKKNHTGTACDDLANALTPSAVFSLHNSTAKLKVSKQPHPYSDIVPIEVISGKLSGNLAGVLEITGLGSEGDIFSGTANLKIKSARGKSHYACLSGLHPSSTAEIPVPTWGTIAECQGNSGPNLLGIAPFAGLYINPATGLPDADFGPVLVPLELHVTDTGTFVVLGSSTGLALEGKLKVKVDSDPLSGTSGSIKISKATAIDTTP